MSARRSGLAVAQQNGPIAAHNLVQSRTERCERTKLIIASTTSVDIAPAIAAGPERAA